MSDKSTEDEVWSAVRSIFESFEARNDAGIEENLAQECTVWDVFEPQLIQGAGGSGGNSTSGTRGNQPNAARCPGT